MKGIPIQDLENQIASLKAEAYKLRTEAKDKEVRAQALQDVQWQLENVLDKWKSSLPKVEHVLQPAPECTCSTAHQNFSRDCLVHGIHPNRVE